MHVVKHNRKSRQRTFDKLSKKTCAWCDNKAIFVRRSRRTKEGTTVLSKRKSVKTDKDHDLCPRCRRSIGDWYYTRTKESRTYL